MAANNTPFNPAQFQGWASFYQGNVVQAPPPPPSAFGASALGQPTGQFTGGWAYPDAWANFYTGQQGFVAPQNQNTPAGALAATNYARNINNPNDPNLLGWERAYGNPQTILAHDQNWANSLGPAPTSTPSGKLTGGWLNPEAWAAYYGGTNGFTAPANPGSPASALAAASQIAKTSNPQSNPALLGWVSDYGQPGSVLTNTPNWAASLGTPNVNAQGQDVGQTNTQSWESPLAWAAFYGGFQGFGKPVDNTLQAAQNWAGVTNKNDPSLLGWELDYGNPQTVVSTIQASPQYQQFLAAQRQFEQQKVEQAAAIRRQRQAAAALRDTAHGQVQSLQQQISELQNQITQYGLTSETLANLNQDESLLLRIETEAPGTDFGVPAVFVSPSGPSSPSVNPYGTLVLPSGIGVNSGTGQLSSVAGINVSGFQQTTNLAPDLLQARLAGEKFVEGPSGPISVNPTPLYSAAGPQGSNLSPAIIGVASAGLSEQAVQNLQREYASLAPPQLNDWLNSQRAAAIHNTQNQAIRAITPEFFNAGAVQGSEFAPGLGSPSNTGIYGFLYNLTPAQAGVSAGPLPSNLSDSAINFALGNGANYLAGQPGTFGYSGGGFSNRVANDPQFRGTSGVTPGADITGITFPNYPGLTPDQFEAVFNEAQRGLVPDLTAVPYAPPIGSEGSPDVPDSQTSFEFGGPPPPSVFQNVDDFGRLIPDVGPIQPLNIPVTQDLPPLELPTSWTVPVPPSSESSGGINPNVTIDQVVQSGSGIVAPEDTAQAAQPNAGARPVVGAPSIQDPWAAAYGGTYAPEPPPPTPDTSFGTYSGAPYAETYAPPADVFTDPGTAFDPDVIYPGGKTQLPLAETPPGVWPPNVKHTAAEEFIQRMGGKATLYQLAQSHGAEGARQMLENRSMLGEGAFNTPLDLSQPLEPQIIKAIPSAWGGEGAGTVATKVIEAMKQQAPSEAVQRSLMDFARNTQQDIQQDTQQDREEGGAAAYQPLPPTFTPAPNFDSPATPNYNPTDIRPPGSVPQTNGINWLDLPSLPSIPDYLTAASGPQYLNPEVVPEMAPAGTGNPVGAARASGVPQGILDQAAAFVKGGGNTAQLKEWMASQGWPQYGNWCAEFVSAVVTAMGGKTPEGIQGPAVPGYPGGEPLATNASSYLAWGGLRTGNPQPGDVFTKKGVPVGEVGGHAGMVYSYDPSSGNVTVFQGNPAREYSVPLSSFQQTYAIRTPDSPYMTSMTPVSGGAESSSFEGLAPVTDIPYNNATAASPASYNLGSAAYVRPDVQGYGSYDVNPLGQYGPVPDLQAGYSYIPGAFGEIDPYYFSSTPFPAGGFGGGYTPPQGYQPVAGIGVPSDIGPLGTSIPGDMESGLAPAGEQGHVGAESQLDQLLPPRPASQSPEPIQAGYRYIPGLFGDNPDPYGNFAPPPYNVGQGFGGGFEEAPPSLPDLQAGYNFPSGSLGGESVVPTVPTQGDQGTPAVPGDVFTEPDPWAAAYGGQPAPLPGDMQRDPNIPAPEAPRLQSPYHWAPRALTARGTEPVAIIIHHTEGGGGTEGHVTDAQNAAGEAQTVQSVQGIHYPGGVGTGPQYVMDRSGNSYYLGTGAYNIEPETARNYLGSADVRPGDAPYVEPLLGEGQPLTNFNVVGMENIAGARDISTQAQINSDLAMIEQYYPDVPVFAHPDVNPGHKQPAEGVDIVDAINAYRNYMVPQGVAQYQTPQAPTPTGDGYAPPVPPADIPSVEPSGIISYPSGQTALSSFGYSGPTDEKGLATQNPLQMGLDYALNGSYFGGGTTAGRYNADTTYGISLPINWRSVGSQLGYFLVTSADGTANAVVQNIDQGPNMVNTHSQNKGVDLTKPLQQYLWGGKDLTGTSAGVVHIQWIGPTLSAAAAAAQQYNAPILGPRGR